MPGSKKGKKMSEGFGRKQSIALLGNTRRRGKLSSPETRERVSRSLLGNKRRSGTVTWNKGLTCASDPRVAEYGRNISKAKIRQYEENPDSHPCRTQRRKSFGQLWLYGQICQIVSSSEVEMECFVRTLSGRRFIDIAIPLIKLGFEFDGAHWHKDKEADGMRDRELEMVGWKIIHWEENKGWRSEGQE